MNTSIIKTSDLLNDFNHYKALYDLCNEEGQDSRQIELTLRKIIIELHNREIYV